MAKFNFEKFSDAVLVGTAEKANGYIKKQETEILQRIESAIDKMVAMSSWTNRTWNLISSFVGVLFYDGELVGNAKGSGAEITIRKRVPGMWSQYRRDVRVKTVLKNPVYSYDITGKGYKSWPFAVSRGVTPKTGRGYAHKALNSAKREARKYNGYSAFIIIAMPYATSPRGDLVSKTKALFEAASNLYGKGHWKTLTIDTGIGDFEY